MAASAATTPLWLPLVVAIVAVLGTLSAAIFTQIWATRRENERWVREQAAEEKRWKQEQEDRRQQWKREDRARWLEERRVIYAELLLGLQTFDEGLDKAENELRTAGQIEAATLSHAKDLYESVRQIYSSFRIIAPNSIADVGQTVLTRQFARLLNLDSGQLEDTHFAAASAERKIDKDRLFKGIRLDLGLED